MAVMVGDLGNARVIAVPTFKRLVARIASEHGMKAEWVVSAAQQDSKPASSMALAMGPIMGSGPPTPNA
jgi:hypothetical protein